MKWYYCSIEVWRTRNVSLILNAMKVFQGRHKWGLQVYHLFGLPSLVVRDVLREIYSSRLFTILQARFLLHMLQLRYSSSQFSGIFSQYFLFLGRTFWNLPRRFELIAPLQKFHTPNVINMYPAVRKKSPRLFHFLIKFLIPFYTPFYGHSTPHTSPTVLKNLPRTLKINTPQFFQNRYPAPMPHTFFKSYPAVRPKKYCFQWL